jgi:DNA-3-methyladenine glycosylase II
MREEPELAPQHLAQGIAVLIRREAFFADIVATAGTPQFARRPPEFGTLLHIILEQQVSIDAAAAMYRRLRTLCVPLEPAAFLRLDEATLRSCGFSRQKIGYARGVAEAIRDGHLDLAALALLDDDAVTAELCRLKGFGRWSAEVYLLFALGRPDIWPADDLGLQRAVQRQRALPAPPAAAALREMAEAWRPWRSVAACLLWQSYLHALGRLPSQAPTNHFAAAGSRKICPG